MKTAWVFGGGGAKGAYEIGVWRALRELHVPIDLMCGTSIGALIGTMVVQDSFDACVALWDQLCVDDVMMDGVNFDFDMELLMSQKGKYKALLQSYVKHKGADISPFETMIERLFDKEKFFSSPIDFACLSVNVTKRKAQVFDKEMMKHMNPCEAILASASCFPAFPMCEIDGDRYIDGGYYDNVPIQLARSMGADHIIAVDLKSVGNKKLHKPQADVVYIEPYVSLGSFLKFDAALIQRNQMLGYQDTMKKFQQYLGTIYTFECKEEIQIAKFEQKAEAFFTSYPCSLMDEEVLRLPYPCLHYLEMCAFLYGLNDIGIYRLDAFIMQMKEIIENYVPTYERLFDQTQTEKQLLTIVKQFSKKDALYYCYHRLIHEQGKWNNMFRMFHVAMKDIMNMALILYFVQLNQK